VTEDEEIVMAYKAAAVVEDDILCEVEKDLRGEENILGERNNRRRKEFMGSKGYCRRIWNSLVRTQ
jgi:hypothetical protein